MSKAFSLRIELGNDAMLTYADIQHAIRHLALPDDLSPRPGHLGGAYDLNGNRVGEWKITRGQP